MVELTVRKVSQLTSGVALVLLSKKWSNLSPNTYDLKSNTLNRNSPVVEGNDFKMTSVKTCGE